MMSTGLLAKPFTEGLLLGVVRYQRCTVCGTAQRLARYACTACSDVNLTWEDASGHGRVFALTEVKRAPTETFKALVPYTLALVDLEEGARVMGHAPPGLQIGDPVRASAFMLGDQVLIRFSPV